MIRLHFPLGVSFLSIICSKTTKLSNVYRNKIVYYQYLVSVTAFENNVIESYLPIVTQKHISKIAQKKWCVGKGNIILLKMYFWDQKIFVIFYSPHFFFCNLPYYNLVELCP
eukprot:Phypoly_transcript_05007.p2 GENE.Phypoly_transcript_05007~~Phypoly_transcript_05007.p2  ORF type:complete len:112 (-),score=1.89 Phypoly_transcript_05007:871-1206(-)